MSRARWKQHHYRFRSGNPQTIGKREILAFLAEQDQQSLVDLLWQLSVSIPSVDQHLRQMVVSDRNTPELVLLKAQIRDLDVDWLEEEDEYAYCDEASNVIDQLSVLAENLPDQAIPYLKQLMTQLGGMGEHCSSECIGLAETTDQAWQVLLEAYAASELDLAEFGRWIAEYRLTGPDMPEIKLEHFAGLLGSNGLDAYWQVLEVANQKDPTRYEVRAARQELIEATGNVDAIVACHAEDLSSPLSYVQIADLLAQDERQEEAIEWLERGRAGLPPADQPHDWRADKLVDRLAELYKEVGRHSEVPRLRDEYLRYAKTAAAYTALRDAVLTPYAEASAEGPAGGAPALDEAAWDEVRPGALRVLRESVRKSANTPQAWRTTDDLVQVLLIEDLIDEAWQLVTDQRYSGQLLLRVTAHRGRTHPEDALRLYFPEIERAVAQTCNAGYERATEMLRILHELPKIHETDFAQQLERLQTTNRRKTNFIAALRRNGM